MDIALILLFGALGGVTRGVVGFLKYFTSYKNVTFSWVYLAVTVGISAVVGLAVVWAIRESGINFEGVVLNPAIAFILGYAGGDVLENVYKILVKKPVLGPLTEIFKVIEKK